MAPSSSPRTGLSGNDSLRSAGPEAPTSLYAEEVLPRFLLLRAAILLTALALGAGALAAPVDADPVAHRAAAKPDPRKSRGLFVDPVMPAYKSGGVYRDRIGRYAQAFWVIPEEYGTATARWDVRAYTARAIDAKKTPVLSVYGIPGRDCGMYSSGNPLTTAGEYRGWIRQVAAGLRDQKAIVVLEPDALSFFSSTDQVCPDKPEGWEGMLRFASRVLSKTGAWVYLDAGHSNWTPHDDRPIYLKKSGIEFARGFSTNVSNFRPTADEQAYAATLLAGLRKLGITGKRYVIDTSRNGVAPADNQVINPPWAEVGRPPRLVFDGSFDGTLWVKHPGESDGYENGGNESGHWCDMLADRLLGEHAASQGCPQD